jgi:hypothetical protein
MPLFFFHIRGADERLSRDEIGLEFPDVRTLYFTTLCAAWDVGAELEALGHNPRDCAIEVMNAANELVFKLPFSEALDYQVFYVRGLLQ